MTLEEIKADFLAFADDESDIIFEAGGDVMFYKNGTEYICQIKSNAEGNKIVVFENESFPYRTFITKKLARLDLFAKRLVDKRPKIDAFVNSPALLKTVYSEEQSYCIELLQKECDNFLEFGSKITFITADAGHGKSALLKQFQYYQAERYIKGESSYLFWHVDLQGRDLVRLPEAIMYDLGELRLPGLYYPSIINLIRKKFIILAIDGFDELAAEIGGMNAVSSLSSFVNEMQGQGTLIPASRRTFFDTHDYLKRTSMLKNKVPYEVNFNELKLQDWNEDEIVEYFNLLDFPEPKRFYDCIATELHEESHPILTRPFLLTKLATAIEGKIDLIPQFFSRSGNRKEGVSLVVEAFTRREVNKWKERDSETGKPYLTFEQHIQFLSVIAKEMWEGKRDFVTMEEVELYTVILLDEWAIEESIKATVLRMVRTHAFLIPITDSRFDSRKFDHEEFKNYFLSRALASLIDRSISTNNFVELKRFLYIDQLSDSVAMYCFNYVEDLENKIEDIIQVFKKLVDDEYRPTYLQLNVGTLFPFMINNINFSNKVIVDSKVSYGSLVFENKTLKNVHFKNGNFINVSLRQTSLTNVEFSDCTFNEVKFEKDSQTVFNNVRLTNCTISGILILREGDIIEAAYSPVRINEILIENKISIDSRQEGISEVNARDDDYKRALNKFLLKFNKMTIQYEVNIREERYLHPFTDLILTEVIPLLERYEIIQRTETKTAKFRNSSAWRLLVSVEDVFRFDGINKSSENNKIEDKLIDFWSIVKNRINERLR